MMKIIMRNYSKHIPCKNPGFLTACDFEKIFITRDSFEDIVLIT